MVSKSEILGESSFIFVTVGSTGFQHDRLFSILDSSLKANQANTLLVAQTGNSRYKFKYQNTITYSYLSPPEIINFIRKGKRIISHAGPISIYLVVKFALNLPLVIPRLAKFNEHVDNHQLFFTKFLRKQLPKKLKKYFVTENDIEQSIGSYLKETPKLNTFNHYIFNKSDKNNVIRKLDKFIATIIK